MDEQPPKLNPPSIRIGPRYNPERQKRAIKAGFKLSPIFYEELLKRLEEERKKANAYFNGIGRKGRGLINFFAQREMYPPTCIPSRQHLELLIEKAFWTSLRKEEGRPLIFSLSYIKALEEPLSTLSFGDALPFDVDTLTKLAPAASRPDSGIVVGPSPEGSLKVRGIRTSDITPFRIRVLDPGSLILTFSTTNIAVISGDEAVFMRNNLLSRSSAIWSKLQGTEKSTEYSAFSDPRVNVILDVTKAMRRLGHGGALLIVPDSCILDDSIAHISYPVVPPFTEISEMMNRLAEENVKEKKDEALRAAFNSIIDSLAKSLAQLTAVDGATIITTDLNIIGFGAKIKEVAESFEVVEIDPLDHDDYLHYTTVESTGGKRHQSAAKFAYQEKDAIALVVSQDGNVTAFVWEEYKDKPNLNALYAYRRLELTLF
jgi:hypothetical protein